MDDLESKKSKCDLATPKGQTEAAQAGERLRKSAYNQDAFPKEDPEQPEQKSISQKLTDSIYSIGQAIKHVFVSDDQSASKAAAGDECKSETKYNVLGQTNKLDNAQERSELPPIKIDMRVSGLEMPAPMRLSDFAEAESRAKASVANDRIVSNPGNNSSDKTNLPTQPAGGQSLLDTLKSGKIDGVGRCDVAESNKIAKTEPAKSSESSSAQPTLLDTLKTAQVGGAGSCDLAESYKAGKIESTKSSETSSAQPSLLETLKAGNIVGKCDTDGKQTSSQTVQAEKTQNNPAALSSIDYRRNVLDSAGEQSVKVLDRAQTRNQPDTAAKEQTLLDALNSSNLKDVGNCEIKPGVPLPFIQAQKSEAPKPADANQTTWAQKSEAAAPILRTDGNSAGSGRRTGADAGANSAYTGTNDLTAKNQAVQVASFGPGKDGDNSARSNGLDRGFTDFRSASGDNGRSFSEARFAPDSKTTADTRSVADFRGGFDTRTANAAATDISNKDFARSTFESRIAGDGAGRNVERARTDAPGSFKRIDSELQFISSADSKSRVAFEASSGNEQRRIAEIEAHTARASATTDAEHTNGRATPILAEQSQQRDRDNRQYADSTPAKPAKDDAQTTAISIGRADQANKTVELSAIPLAQRSSSTVTDSTSQTIFAGNQIRMQSNERANVIGTTSADKASTGVDKAQSLSTLVLSSADKTGSITVSDRAAAVDRTTAVLASANGMNIESAKFSRNEDGVITATGRKDASTVGVTTATQAERLIQATENSGIRSSIIADTAGRNGAQKDQATKSTDKNAELAGDGSRLVASLLPGQNNIAVKGAGLEAGLSITRGELILKEGDTALSNLPERVALVSSEKRYLTGVEITVAAILTISGAAKLRDERKQLIQEMQEALDSDNQAQVQILHRRTQIVSPGQTLLSIAEDIYENSAVAWLIADLNRNNIKDEWIEGKRVIELKSRQLLELPESHEVANFLARLPRDFEATNMVTIVSDNTIDRELLDSFLGTVSGAPVSNLGRSSAPARIELEHSLPELSIAMEEGDGIIDEPALSNIVKDLSNRVGRLLKRPHGKLKPAT